MNVVFAVITLVFGYLCYLFYVLLTYFFIWLFGKAQIAKAVEILQIKNQDQRVEKLIKSKLNKYVIKLASYHLKGGKNGKQIQQANRGTAQGVVSAEQGTEGGIGSGYTAKDDSKDSERPEGLGAVQVQLSEPSKRVTKYFH